MISEYDTSRYPDDDAAIIAVKSGVMDMSDEIFADWPAGGFTGFVGMGMMGGTAPAPADPKPIAPEPPKPV